MRKISLAMIYWITYYGLISKCFYISTGRVLLRLTAGKLEQMGIDQESHRHSLLQKILGLRIRDDVESLTIFEGRNKVRILSTANLSILTTTKTASINYLWASELLDRFYAMWKFQKVHCINDFWLMHLKNISHFPLSDWVKPW